MIRHVRWIVGRSELPVIDRLVREDGLVGVYQDVGATLGRTGRHRRRELDTADGGFLLEPMPGVQRLRIVRGFGEGLSQEILVASLHHSTNNAGPSVLYGC